MDQSSGNWDKIAERYSKRAVADETTSQKNYSSREIRFSWTGPKIIEIAQGKAKAVLIVEKKRE